MMKQAGIRSGLIGAGAALALLAGCGSSDEKEIEEMTAQEIFNTAEFELEERSDPEDAAEYFAEVERLYPYSELAKRALIMQAFSHHQAKDYENSRAAAQRYIDFYPADQDAAYAQ